MEELFPLLIVFIGAIGSIVSAASKSKNSKAATARHQSDLANRLRTVQAQQEAASQPLRTPVQPQVVASAPAMAPQVHTHYQPDCDTHDAPSGSLSVTSTEGKDPCHEAQLTHARSFQEPAQEEPGMTFDWSGENMVKAFVMQEVLTRPCQRQAR